MTVPTVPAPDARDEYAPPTVDELAREDDVDDYDLWLAVQAEWEARR